MADQNRGQSGRNAQRRADAPLDAYNVGLNMSLLDWNQLEPLGEAEAMAADQDLDFLPDLANELLDEGTDDEVLTEQSSESEVDRLHHLRGGKKDPQGAPVVTTGGNAESSPTAQGPSAVTTGQVPAGRTRGTGRAAARRGRRNMGPSASASSGSGTQPAGFSNDPSAEPSSDSGKGKRKKPTPNLDAIDDPAERRKQRRLAKNRATAAVSRERKRVQMIQLAARTRALEQENANLQFMLGLRDQEIGKLRGNLASFPRSARDGEPRTQSAAASPSEPAELTGVALPLAVTLQQLCLRAPRRSRAALSVLACIMFFLALICLGNPPSQPHPFWAPLEPTRSYNSQGEEGELDWGAPMAWGWPFLLRLAGAHRRRQRPLRPAASGPSAPVTSPMASLPTTGLVPGAWSITGRAGSSSLGNLAALWGPSQELAMQGSWENLAALLGNPLPLPLEALPFEEARWPQNSSSSSMERHLLEDQVESSSQSSAYLMHSGNNSMDQTPRETLPIQPDRINKVMTVDIQTGNRQMREQDPAPELAPPTPPRAQGATTLKRSLQKKLAARKAAAVIAKSVALGPSAGFERPYFKVALGLPLLPKVPITKAEAKRRASVKLLPLGMALLAAESFVQERLYSADICKNVLGS